MVRGGLFTSETLVWRRRLQSEQVNTVVICRGILGVAEFNATQNSLTCLGILKGTSGSGRGGVLRGTGRFACVCLCARVCVCM